MKASLCLSVLTELSECLLVLKILNIHITKVFYVEPVVGLVVVGIK